jgi:hypothetical protein
MIIANPLYDTAFKGLISDHEVAKVLIGTLLQTEVLKVEPMVTEHIKPMKDDDLRPKCLRLDYAALIKNEKGEEQKILIEVQKATGAENILRFREYLAVAGYMKKDEEESPLPIVTIYFLGFKLENVPTPCLKVARQYVDMLENKVLQTKEKFVELLTHDSFVIQTPRINTIENPKTELEKILSVFEQRNFVDGKETAINYTHPVEDGSLKKMINILQYIYTDPEERKKMDEEAYWNTHDENTTGVLWKAQEELKRAREDLEEAQQKNKNIAKELKLDGMPVEKISKLTGLTIEEIEKL